MSNRRRRQNLEGWTPELACSRAACPEADNYYPVAPYYAYPSYAYASPVCSWQPGYWVNHPSVDAWGRYIYVQQWVPAQYVCY